MKNEGCPLGSPVSPGSHPGMQGCGSLPLVLLNESSDWECHSLWNPRVWLLTSGILTEWKGTYHERTEGPCKQPRKCPLFIGHGGTVSAMERENRWG